MGLLLIKPAEVMLFYTGADTVDQHILCRAQELHDENREAPQVPMMIQGSG